MSGRLFSLNLKRFVKIIAVCFLIALLYLVIMPFCGFYQIHDEYDKYDSDKMLSMRISDYIYTSRFYKGKQMYFPKSATFYKGRYIGKNDITIKFNSDNSILLKFGKEVKLQIKDVVLTKKIIDLPVMNLSEHTPYYSAFRFNSTKGNYTIIYWQGNIKKQELRDTGVEIHFNGYYIYSGHNNFFDW